MRPVARVAHLRHWALQRRTQLLAVAPHRLEVRVYLRQHLRVRLPLLRERAQVEVPPQRSVERAGNDELRAQPREALRHRGRCAAQSGERLVELHDRGVLLGRHACDVLERRLKRGPALGKEEPVRVPEQRLAPVDGIREERLGRRAESERGERDYARLLARLHRGDVRVRVRAVPALAPLAPERLDVVLRIPRKLTPHVVVDGVEFVRERGVSVALVRARVEHHASLRRDELCGAAHLPRRLVNDGRGQALESDGLPRYLPLRYIAARRDGEKRGERRIRLAVGVVHLRLEENVLPGALHRLAPHRERIAALSAVARSVHPLRAEPVRRAARPGADDQGLAEGLQRLLPRADREGDLPAPVAAKAALSAAVAHAVESVVVPQARNYSRDPQGGAASRRANSLRRSWKLHLLGNFPNGLNEELARGGVARTHRALLPGVRRRHALRRRMRRDELVVPPAVPLRGVASVNERIRRNLQLRAFAQQLRVRPAALQVDGVRAGGGDPVRKRLARAAHVERAHFEVRVAHERIALRLHPAIRLVVRIEERPLRRRLDDELNFFAGTRPLHDISVVPERKPGRDLIRNSGGYKQVKHRCLLPRRRQPIRSAISPISGNYIILPLLG